MAESIWEAQRSGRAEYLTCFGVPRSDCGFLRIETAKIQPFATATKPGKPNTATIALRAAIADPCESGCVRPAQGADTRRHSRSLSWQIQMSHRSVSPPRFGVVGSGRFLSRIEHSEVDASNGRDPKPVLLANTLEPAAIVSGQSLVSGVCSLRHGSKVRSAIVKTVSVDVVHNHIGWRTQYEAVQPDLRTRWAAARVERQVIATLRCAPTPRQDTRSIDFVNDCELSLSQGDSYTRHTEHLTCVRSGLRLHQQRGGRFVPSAIVASGHRRENCFG